MKILLADSRVDPSAQGNLAVLRASQNSHTEVVKILLADSRIDPSINDNYAIKFASMNGFPEVMKLLLADKRVDPSANNNEPIRWAFDKWTQRGTDVAKLLLASDKIALQVKTQMLKDSNLPGLNYESFELLAKKSLEELISLGNRNQDYKDIIMTKYFWWLRLKILHNMDNIKGDPFEVALQQE